MRRSTVTKDPTTMTQRSFASAEYAMKKKRTRREKFLGEMERIVPWARLGAVIEPLYPTSGRVGRQPIGINKMLRMYCLQQWYGLADEALEDALYDSQALRDFVGIDLSRESVPDATTLLKFRHLLQDNNLTRALFEEINAHLGQKGRHVGLRVDGPHADDLGADDPDSDGRAQRRDGPRDLGERSPVARANPSIGKSLPTAACESFRPCGHWVR
jgi:transposase, IS5 family